MRRTWTVALLAGLLLARGLRAEPPTAAPPPATGTVGPLPVADPAAGPVHGPDWFVEGHSEPAGFAPGPWFEADLLVWWVKGDRLPPLVTTSPAGTPRAQAGVLGQPGTVVLFGDERVNGDSRLGLRLRGGWWLDCGGCPLGIDVSYFCLESTSATFDAASDGSTILARPFIDARFNVQASTLTAFPGVSTGQISVSETSAQMRGWEIHARETFLGGHEGGGFRLDVFAGYRALCFDERLAILESQVSIAPLELSGVIPGTTLATTDRFDINNIFHGAQIGFEAVWEDATWRLSLLTKLAAGVNAREMDINGLTRVQSPGAAPSNSVGGLLTQTTNVGRWSDADGLLLPELGLNAAFRVNDGLSVRVGYSILYWSEVFRPGKQLDTVVNPLLFPPTTNPTTNLRPRALFETTDLWVQGLNFGVELRY